MSSGDIIIATQRGDLKAVNYFLEDPEIDTMDVIDAVVDAVEYGYLEIFKRFLQEFWIDFGDIEGILVYPARRGDWEMLDLILRKISPPPLSEYNQALIEASRRGHLEVLERLMKERGDPSILDNLPLVLASRRKHRKVIRRLLEDDRVFELYQPYLS